MNVNKIVRTGILALVVGLIFSGGQGLVSPFLGSTNSPDWQVAGMTACVVYFLAVVNR